MSAEGIDRRVLSEAFQDAMRGWRLKAGVFLTFRFDAGFFEQQVLPIFFDIAMSHAPVARVLHLADALRETGPIAVYYDRRALEPGPAPKTDFQRVGLSHTTGYFHPKNVLLLVESTSPPDEWGSSVRPKRLIVASMSANLTQSGWWEGVEVAHLETVDPDIRCSFRGDLLSLTDRVRRVAPPGIAHPALDEVDAFIRTVEQDHQRLRGGLMAPRLFWGQADLPEFLEELAGNRLRGRCLEVISPYFDDAESLIPVTELMRRFKPAEVRVFLPRGKAGEALCSERYWEQMRAAGVVWGTLPADVVKFTREADRFVHAKVFRFFSPVDRRQTFFVGSVNLTNAGFRRSGNVESGFLIETEGKRRSDWWLATSSRRPASFESATESDGLAAGPGVNLSLRFDWTTMGATAYWDREAEPPTLTILGAGVKLGELAGLPPRAWQRVDRVLASALGQHLLSSSFVKVAVDAEEDATILVDEDGAVDKPSLLSTLSPADILRFWSLLTDAQKQEFFEEHAGELDNDELRLWLGRSLSMPEGQGMFGTFAHIFLSFGNLERAVRRALEEGRPKEAVDRVFGRQFDSVRKLLERIADKIDEEPVRGYVTVLCALQLLYVLKDQEPEFYARHSERFALIDEAGELRDRIKGHLDLGADTERQAFCDWFERWFLKRATPARQEASA
jgi:hypothetical protein